MSAVVFVLLEIGIAVGVWRLGGPGAQAAADGPHRRLFAGGLRGLAPDADRDRLAADRLADAGDQRVLGRARGRQRHGAERAAASASACCPTRRASCAPRSGSTRASPRRVWAASSTTWSTSRSAWPSCPPRSPPTRTAGSGRPASRCSGCGRAATGCQRSAADRDGRPPHLAGHAARDRRTRSGEPSSSTSASAGCCVVMRDWTPVIATSRNGTRVLVAIAELRKDLVELEAHLGDDRQVVEPMLVSLRVARPAAGLLPGAEERRGPAAPGGARRVRPAAGHARVLGVGGRPVGARPVRRRVDQGPAGGDRGPRRARARTRVEQLGSWARTLRERQAGAERPARCEPPARPAVPAPRSGARRGPAPAARRRRRATATGVCAAANSRTAGSASPRRGREAAADAQALGDRERLAEPVALVQGLRSSRRAGLGEIALDEGGPGQRDASRRGTTVGRRWPAIASASAANAPGRGRRRRRRGRSRPGC